MKKKLIIIICAVVVIIGAGGFFLKNQMDEKAKKENTEQLTKLVKLYYEDYLYDILIVGKSEDEAKAFLSQYEKNGLITTIEDIEKVSEIDSKKIMDKLGDACDKKANSVTITPKDPFGREDYKIKVVCE